MEPFSVTPNKTVDVDGTSFTYRDVGPRIGTPVIFLHHLTAVLDDWDPAVVDGIAAVHRQYPEVPIYCAAVDRQLNERGYILPGLGDAGDRIFGT